MFRGGIPDVCEVFYEKGNSVEIFKVVHEGSRIENNE